MCMECDMMSSLSFFWMRCYDIACSLPHCYRFIGQLVSAFVVYPADSCCVMCFCLVSYD